MPLVLERCYTSPEHKENVTAFMERGKLVTRV